MESIRIAVLGAGGLGKAACRMIGMKRELVLTAICDSHGVLYDPAGLPAEALTELECDVVTAYEQQVTHQATRQSGGTTTITQGSTMVERTSDGIGRIIEQVQAGAIDGIFVALPNLPNTFMPGVVRRFLAAGAPIVMTDALKRTQAMDEMFTLDPLAKESGAVYLTGCGATPGLLTAAAVVAAQSFVEIEHVDIYWGVGMPNWDAYKATIREDIAHLPGFNVARAQAMTDADVEALLETTDGRLELHEMEHADDVLLQRVGVIRERNQVTVSGVMDTRHAKKPVSTTMTLTGRTYDGSRASHRFILGDETTMAANVVGPALGYLKRGLWLKAHGIHGVFGSTEFMPMVVQ
jgi:hypothetical protein